VQVFEDVVLAAPRYHASLNVVRADNVLNMVYFDLAPLTRMAIGLCGLFAPRWYAGGLQDLGQRQEQRDGILNCGVGAV
jgi:hypothetical protein